MVCWQRIFSSKRFSLKGLESELELGLGLVLVLELELVPVQEQVLEQALGLIILA
jgi:hypothetical protein